MECAQWGNVQGHSCTSLPFSGFASSADKLSQKVFPVALQSVTVSLFQQPLCAPTPNFCFQTRLSQISTSLYLCRKTELESSWDGLL